MSEPKTWTKDEVADTAMDEGAVNPRAVIGDNRGPLSPFEIAEKRIEDLYGESLLWLDGAECDSQDLSDGISNLKGELLKARKAADESRDTEKRPFLESGREVDARYKPLLTKADMAIDACKKAVAPWLKKVADEQAAIALAARQKADREREAAQAALRASDVTNLAEREAAEALLDNAKQAEPEAVRAAKAKPLSGGAVGRRDGLTTVYSAQIVDPIAFGRWAWTNRREAYDAFLQGLADQFVRFGDHTEDELPGCKITSERKVR